MTQMLKLSAEEKDQLVAIAQGNNSVLGRMGRVWPSGTHGSSVVRAFAHDAMGRRIDPSWGGPIELFLIPATASRLV